MCPEPVAPGYEYSDVFEEVVKLHPPVGQLILEEIDKWVGWTRWAAVIALSTPLLRCGIFCQSHSSRQISPLVQNTGFVGDPSVG